MIVFSAWIGLVVAVAGSASGDVWWGPEVEASLDRAPSARAGWLKQLEACPPEHRESLAYLVKYLPRRDLEKLSPSVLAANVELADRVRGEVPWGPGLPDAIFLDAVLPHASVTEPRDSMRVEFHDRYLPMVRGCKRPGDAGQLVNRALFRDYKVVYNTRRLRTDQCSRESIRQGMATCTGLSIMLVEACRAVGVPARLAGIAAWPGRGGNHTWVEVWDDGWHFVGAAEPDDRGLDHAWFVGDAAKAIPGGGRNAIHAITYRTTGTFFPMVWAESARVPAEEVTGRYGGARGSNPPASSPRLMVEVRRGGNRVEAEVTTLDLASGAVRPLGSSLGPSADVNRHLTCEAPAGRAVLIVARLGGAASVRAAKVEGDTVVRVDLDRPPPAETRAELARTFADRFGADEARRAAARKVLAALPWDESMRTLAWTAYRTSPMHDPLRREFDAKIVATKDRRSAYLWRHVGQKPAGGWSLVIAMHGGGGAPKHVNDEQWHSMFERYYREHPEVGGYVYLALRAPNDEWNGFYDDAICPMVERLIRQFVLFGDVNPDRVYALGASHGGYGAFVIGPKIPDRFAAVHASAAAPTDGETRAENLRDLRFSVMVGDRDTAYGRVDRCRAFVKVIAGLKDRYGGFPGEVAILPGVGHSVPDRDMVATMLKAGPRSPWPDRVVWAMSDDVIRHFYWIEALHPGNSGRIEARARDNSITLETKDQDEVALWLDAPFVDLARPVTVDRDGRKQTFTPRPDPETYCQGLESRGDPRLAAPARIPVGRTP